MHGNETVTNIIYSTDVWTTVRWLARRRSAEHFGAADWRSIFVLGSYFYLLYFHYLINLWLRTWYNIDDTTAAGWNKRNMIFDRVVTLKQGKTYCGRGLITDPIIPVVTDAGADLWIQPSGVESIEMHVSLTSKYGCEMLTATCTAILLVCIAAW